MAFGKKLLTVLTGLVLYVSFPVACLAQPAAPADASPFTCLFDTGAVLPTALTGDALNGRKGWTAVSEDILTHTFAGDAVFMNDRVAVVLRRNSAGAEVYSKSAAGSKHRATLLPLGADGGPGAFSNVKIIENSQAAVMVEAAFTAQSGAVATVQFRLTAGESLLDVRGAKGASRLRVCDQSQYVVVPDFFADDLVVDPAAIDRARVGLPAENSVLGLTDTGNAIVACVWPSSRQNVDLLVAADGPSRAITSYEIDLAQNNRLWIAVMEGAGIWHVQHMTGSASSAELALQWKPPMPAHWRADFAAADGMSTSSYFADAESGPTPTLAKSIGVCRFDAGRALIRVIDSTGVNSLRLVVVYPIERTRATPLTAFCLVDIMRNALGFGPCQYVLDAEGLGSGESPTPEQVTHWVEKQFEKKVSKRDVEAIREQLSKMTLQVKRTDERIGQYIVFALKVKQECAEHSANPAHAAAVSRLLAIADSIAVPPAATLPTVERLASSISAQADRDDALAKCQQLLAAIQTAGANQDYTLAKMRMAARRLKQECRTLAIEDEKAASLAAQIQSQAEKMLVKK